MGRAGSSQDQLLGQCGRRCSVAGRAPVPGGPVADRSSSRDFDDLYRRDWARLCRFLFVLGATWEEACDVAQDTYMKLLEDFDCIERPEAWVRTAAKNRLFDLRRKRRA